MLKQQKQTQQQYHTTQSQTNTQTSTSNIQSIQKQLPQSLCNTLYCISKSQLNTVYEIDNRFEEYINMLKKYGAIINPKLQCGYFKLKNGLKYPGLYTKQDINIGAKINNNVNIDNNINKIDRKQQILVSIPIQMLLTSYRAQNEANQQLKYIFKTQQFYHEGPIWQDRILVTYILYNIAYNNNRQNLWSQMSSYFSKDIDIISFWPQSDINSFMDKSVIQAAHLQRQNFDKQWNKFKQIQQKYKQLKHQIFTYDNYKWIYTHAISRCFGSYMNSTYFTPYCQLFNHNCVDVSYCCLQMQQYQKKINNINNKQIQKEEKSNNQKQYNNNNIPNIQQQLQQISDISQCSGDSQDYIQDGDFSYYQVQTYTIKWNTKISYKLKQKQLKQTQQLQSKVILYLQTQLKWKGISLMYIGQILQKVYLIGNQYMAERKKYIQAKQQLQILMYHIGQFKRNIYKYYKNMGSKYMKQKNINTNMTHNINQQSKQYENKQIQQNNYIKTNKPPQKQYKYFTMICHPNQYYPKNSQVYFQYGRLSNRTLLLRYGFCLQNNKYEHVWIRKQLYKQIGQYPDLFAKIQQKCLPITMNIKLKPYVLNTQLIILQKVEKWKIYGKVEQNNKDFQKMFGIFDIQYQIQIIQRVIQIYKQQLQKYQYKKQQNNNNNNIKYKIKQYGLIDLTDKQLGYHDYFICVYNNEKIKILLLQIQLLNKAIKILKKILLEKITIKGNTKLMQIVKQIVIQEMGSKNRAKFIWGYIKNLQLSIMQ